MRVAVLAMDKKVLELNKQLLQSLGLIVTSNRTVNVGIQLWNGILIAIQLAVWFPICAHLLYIWGDISGTTDAMYTVCTFSMALEMYVIFVLRKMDLSRLFHELDGIIQKSIFDETANDVIQIAIFIGLNFRKGSKIN